MIASFNLRGQPVSADLPAVLLPLGVLVFMIYYLSSTRGTALPAAVPLAEEVHSSPLWGIVIIASGVGVVAGALRAPLGSLRIMMGLICMLILASGLAAWSGFHYSFTQYGSEISTLGFRLRSIPKEQIERYSIEPWSFFRGYGIRGVGNQRAYVWGNSGVQIETSQGKVYLGHSDPEQIVHDLDMITQNRKAHQASS
jgi:hypothetical protein